MRITINGCEFYRTKAAAIGSLFDSPRTASGTFRADKSGIRLYDMRGERIGGINRGGVLYRSFLVEGKLFHQIAEPNGIPAYASYANRVEEARELIRQLAAGEI